MVPGPTTETVATHAVQEPAISKRLSRFQKAAIVSVVLVAIVVVGAFVASLPSPSGTAPVAAIPSWHTTNTYSGSGAGSKRTDTFAIRASQFRVLWNETSCDPTLAGGLTCGFSFAIYSATGQSRIDGVTPAVTGSPQGGTEYVNGGPGNFYVFILSFGPGWSMTVEDYH